MRHIVIPDCQVRPGDDTKYLERIGKYIVELKPDVVVQIGDFADLPSLSSYDIGKKSFEGRRYKNDIQAANEAMEVLLAPLQDFNSRAKRNKEKQYKPKLVLTLGNHEDRISRAVNNDPKLDGTIGLSDLKYSDYGWDVVPFLQPVVLHDVAYCLAPHHRVLTSSLRYIPLRDISIGQSIISFEENASGRGRKYKTGTILKKEITLAKTYEVTLSNGKKFVCTLDHRWIVKGNHGVRWAHTSELTIGTKIPRYFDEFTHKQNYETGWLAGMLDGEGWLSKPNTKQGGIQIGIAQNEGQVLEKLQTLLSKYGYPYETGEYTKCRKIRVGGISASKLKLLGEIRPERLVSKFKPEMLGRMQAIEFVTVEKIEPAGEQEIVQIETDTATLIVDGYAHHNCHYFTTGIAGRPSTSAQAQLAKQHMSCIAGHQQGLQIATGHRADGSRLTSIIAGSCYEHDEDYLGPQGNKHWRGILVLHEVQNGQFDLMPISLNYLERKYG